MDDQLTQLLENWRAGDSEALNHIMALVYDHFKAVVHGVKQRAGGHCNLFSTTEIAHETYLKVQRWLPKQTWHHRGEFFALLGRMILAVLVDEARHNRAHKRGGEAVMISIDGAEAVAPSAIKVVWLRQALDDLQRRSVRQANLWKCRYVIGCSARECAELFGLSEATVHRELKAASGWLGYLLDRGARP